MEGTITAEIQVSDLHTNVNIEAMRPHEERKGPQRSSATSTATHWCESMCRQQPPDPAERTSH